MVFLLKTSDHLRAGAELRASLNSVGAGLWGNEVLEEEANQDVFGALPRGPQDTLMSWLLEPPHLVS